MSFVLRRRDAARTVRSFGVLVSEEGVHAAGRNRNHHPSSHLRVVLPALWGHCSGGFFSPMPYRALSSNPRGLCVLSRTLPPSSCHLSQLCPLLLAAFGSLALPPPCTCSAAWMPAPAITRGSPGPPHPTCRVSDTPALSALFRAEDKLRPCHSVVVGAKGSLQPGTTALWFSAFYGPPWL